MRVVVLIDDGYEELETMGPIALLRRGGVDVDIVRLEKEDVTGRFGVQYTPTIPCSAAASVEFGFALLEALTGKTHADQVKESVYYGFDH